MTCRARLEVARRSSATAMRPRQRYAGTVLCLVIAGGCVISPSDITTTTTQLSVGSQATMAASGPAASADASDGVGTTAGADTDTDTETGASALTGSDDETQAEAGTESEDSGSQDSDGQDSGDDDGDGYFPAGAIWYSTIENAKLSNQSAAIIADLDAHGWGLSRAQIDFSFEVLEATAATSHLEFEPTDEFYTPDCDHVSVPVPDGGNLEGESGYACETDGDCHLIVVDRDQRRLYEMWRADIRGQQFNGGCLAVWDMDRVYGPEGRGEQCTSSDAAGYPIAPLLVTADEVAAGSINHALRFILPNSAIRAGEYVHPATHATGATSGGPSAPPYGVRLRLRLDYPLESLGSDAARTVARALQHYGMFLADGGNVLFTFQSDRRTSAKWEALLGPRDLDVLTPRDFEVVAFDEPIELTNDCQRQGP